MFAPGASPSSWRFFAHSCAQVVDKDIFPSNQLPISNPLELTSSEAGVENGTCELAVKGAAQVLLRFFLALLPYGVRCMRCTASKLHI